MDESIIQLIALKDAEIQALRDANKELLSKIELLKGNSDAIIDLVKQLNPDLFNGD